MTNVFSEGSESNLLKDERFLYPDYVPEILSFRDSEISEMVFCLKPSATGKKPVNLFLTGLPGTGKTASSKFVLSELCEFSDRAKTVYVNCFEFSTKNSILANITNKLGYPVPIRGLSSEEIFDRFVAVIRTKKIVPVIVFDEAEQLLKNEDTKKLLYDLSRINEQFQLFLGLVFISNDDKFLSFLDDRIRSSLNASVIKFEKYTHHELKEILEERAKFAFSPNALIDGVISLCAAHAAVMGDARLAIDTLLKSARIAEKSNSKKVELKHVRSAFLQEKPAKIEIVSNLSTQESCVLDLVSKEDLTAGEIYVKLKDKFAERTLRKAIASLEEKKMISTKKAQKGKGFTRIISQNKTF